MSGGSIPYAVELIAQSQGPGRYICPKCSGGSDGERSLSIRLDEAGEIHWRCFRALCGYTGGPRGTRSAFATVKREPRHFTRPTSPLTEAQEDLILGLYGISPDEVEGYSAFDDRFILGVYGPVGHNRRGCLAYSLSGAKPKSLTYNAKPDEPFIHYAWHNFADKATGRGVVIVEDWFSAEKVARTGAVGAAIMGTHLSQDMVTELVATAAGRPTFLALDRDAYPKTLLYIGRYREQFPGGLFAWGLVKDLKYVSVERITEALVNGKTDFSCDVGKPERV